MSFGGFLPVRQGFLGGQSGTAPSLPIVRVIPFGMEQTVSYGSGTSNGPAAMIAASLPCQGFTLFDDELWNNPASFFRVETLATPKIAPTAEGALEQLACLTRRALEDRTFPFTFGGEHAITPGALRPFVERWPDIA
ncbi:MAG: arginase family protein, partial [Pseudomonadota bacterium]